MRGSVTLSASGGAPPPRGPGDGKRGSTSFDKSGTTVFKGGSSSSRSPGQGPAIFKAAYTCAGLGVVGDLLAQTITKRSKAPPPAGKGAKPAPAADPGYDLARTGRQCAYNFVFYGPAQHFWYAALAKWFPMAAGATLSQNLSPFAVKVFLNQAVLGPVVVATFFAWSMTLQGQGSAYMSKMRQDAFPTLKRGWVFWVPAASVNFAVVPLRFQVLYMSCCSIVWNYILSTAAAKGGAAPVAAAAGKRK